MDPLSVFFILIPIGLAVGIFSSITGLGGGVLMVPILFLGIFEFSNPIQDTIKYATTISSTVIIFAAISGTIAFSIQKRIDYIVGLICIPFTIAGAFLGKFAQAKIDDTIVLIFFAVLTILTAARMYYKIYEIRRKSRKEIKTNPDKSEEFDEKEIIDDKPSRFKVLLNKLTLEQATYDKDEIFWNYKARLYLTPLALVGGFIASMAGVGGGIVMVPILNILIGLPIHFSAATSVFIMIFTKLSTLISSYTNPAIETNGIWYPFVTGMVIGIIAGAQIGAIIAKKIKADPLKIIFATVLVLVSIWTIINWQLGIVE